LDVRVFKDKHGVVVGRLADKLVGASGGVGDVDELVGAKAMRALFARGQCAQLHLHVGLPAAFGHVLRLVDAVERAFEFNHLIAHQCRRF
jgi:hypothetical protein